MLSHAYSPLTIIMEFIYLNNKYDMMVLNLILMLFCYV